MKALVFDTSLPRIALVKGLSRVWKGAPLSRLSPVKLAEVPEPELPGPNWVKFRNRLCGVCGTDIHFIFLEIDPWVSMATVPAPRRKFLGHELVGEVVEAGRGAEGFSPGDRVVLKIDWPSCHQREDTPLCRPCAEGNYLLCERPGGEGLPSNPGGGFSRFMVAHKSQLMRIGEDMPDADAIFLEPTACAVRAVLKRTPRDGDRVLVVGAGAIGLNLIQVIRAVSPRAEVHALCRYPHQEEMARRMGAAGVLGEKDIYRSVARITGGKHLSAPLGNEMILGGFDIVFDSVGSDRSLTGALRWARSGGAVVLVGVNFAPRSLDYSPVWFQEVDLVGINSHGMERFRGKEMTSFEVAYTLYREGKLHFGGLLTHTFPLAEYKKALDTFFRKSSARAIKIALAP